MKKIKLNAMRLCKKIFNEPLEEQPREVREAIEDLAVSMVNLNLKFEDIKPIEKEIKVLKNVS